LGSAATANRFPSAPRRTRGTYRSDTNARFRQFDEKIDRHFALLVGIQVATITAFVSALVALYVR